MKIRKMLAQQAKKGDWLFRKATASLRLLPGFIIFGVARAGTTSLYNYLTAHPKVAKATVKEVMFFDAKFNQGMNWYKAHFPTLLFKKYSMAGEASPSYIHDPLVPQRIKAALPKVKLIILLRNPIDRAYSHYLYAVRAGRETLSFETAVKLQMAERSCFEQQDVLDDPKHHQRVFHRYGYLSKSMYVNNLKRWFDTFPAEQILVLKSEDLYADSEAVVAKTLAFLELPPWTLEKYEKYNAEGQHFVLNKRTDDSNIKKYDHMSLEVRQMLIEYFKPHNQALAEFLNMELDWDK